MSGIGAQPVPAQSARHSRVPASTYRLQVRPGFELSAVAEVVAYLAALGVGALYLSPLLPSSHGSAHGYDVIAWDGIDPQRGGAAGWAAVRTAAAAAGLELVVDIVPNHAGIGVPGEDVPWSSVLELGQQSPYAHWFDIEWWPDGRIRRYRRFFAVDSLAGLRVEDEDVFEATHQTILRWVRAEGVTGLRIDHPDGLADPLGYLIRLRSLLGPECWLLVEKILEPGEALPADWPVDGTTGYDALAEITAVLLDPDGGEPLTGTYQALTRDPRTFSEHVDVGKREVASGMLRPEVERLARLAPDVDGAAEAITEVLIALAVYRSYAPEGLDHLATAVEVARETRPSVGAALDALRPRLADPQDELCVRFQQSSGAVMAKGVEDTAYYRYARMVGLNEVGGEPGLLDRPRNGSAVQQWHVAQRARQQRAARSMTTLSTHDTKRGEDVRARLAVLAELPREWSGLAESVMAAAPLPDGPFAYLLWQTFVGAGFIERSRMHAYAEKAMREAGTSTNWLSPEAAFEAAVHTVIDRAYEDPAVRAPLEDFIERITPYGWINSLSQKLLQLTMPGVPDLYQGTETWDDSLVDPDNRRPVDFTGLASRLSALTSPPVVDQTGEAKLWLTSRVLRARREHPELFASYCPVQVAGEAAGHAVAYDRGGAIAVVTRLPVGLARSGGWREASITVGPGYTEVLTGRAYAGEVALADLLQTYPVALLA